MKVREPIPHWNNFTVPELREILEHCVALERLGIAQDEEMILSIERDITLREKSPHRESSIKTKRQIERRQGETDRIIRRTLQHAKRESRDHLLEQKV